MVVSESGQCWLRFIAPGCRICSSRPAEAIVAVPSHRSVARQSQLLRANNLVVTASDGDMAMTDIEFTDGSYQIRRGSTLSFDCTLVGELGRGGTLADDHS